MSNSAGGTRGSSNSLPLTVGSLVDSGPEWDLKQIYGREKESKIIQDHIDKRSNGTIVIKGISGSGKSALVESQNFEEKGWVFAPGKYELQRKQEPYSALIDALNNLVDQWILYNRCAEKCRLSSFRNLLDDNENFLGSILPKTFRDIKSELKQLNVQKNVLESNVDGTAINAAFFRIISFLSEAKPIVFFLDDIQWADRASLDAIRSLATTGGLDGFLLILSYREEEVSEGDCVWKCIDFINREGEHVETIHVTDLDAENVNALVSSVLELEPTRTLHLSQVIHGKTAGNPFFVVQFLQMLRQESFLKFNFMTFSWEWGDIQKMDQVANVSDNVADVIAASMSKLPLATRIVLKMASCLGKVIPLQILIDFLATCATSSVEHKYEDETICEALLGIQMQGLKNVLDDGVKFGILARLNDGETYLWAHDKLQTVAYSMIDEEVLSFVHNGLGMVLWEKYKSNPEDCMWLYMAAEQLNRVNHVSDENAILDIARLNFQAGKLSISKSAFFPALDMIQSAARRLKGVSNPWEADYQLTLGVYSSLAELGIRFGAREEAFDAANQIDKNARKLEDRRSAHFFFIKYKVDAGDRDYAGAAEIAKTFLLEYDVKFPSKIIPGQLFIEQSKMKCRLGGDAENILKTRKLDDQNNFEDKRTMIILELLHRIVEYNLYVNNVNLATFATLRILNISLKNGTCAATAGGIAMLAGNLSKDGQHEEAKRLGKLAIKLLDSFPLKIGSAHATVHTWVSYGVLAQTEQFHRILDPLLDLNRTALRCGGIVEGVTAWIGYGYTYLSVGLPLDPLESDLLSFSNETRQFSVAETLKVLFPIFRQTIQNLRVPPPKHQTILKGDIFDQEKDLKRLTGAGLSMTLRDLNSFRLMLACIYRDWDAAEELVAAQEQYLDSDRMVTRRHIYLVYMGYASVVLASKAHGMKALHYRQLAKKIYKIFKDMLKEGSMNVLPIIKMMEAIEFPSKENFDEAIRNTARVGLIHHAAVVYENAGLFCMEQGSVGQGEYYLAEATKLYTEWGATGKAKQLMETYDFLNHFSLLDRRSSTGAIKGRIRFSPSDTNPLKEVSHRLTAVIHLGDRESDFSSQSRTSTSTTVPSDSSSDASTRVSFEHKQ